MWHRRLRDVMRGIYRLAVAGHLISAASRTNGLGRQRGAGVGERVRWGRYIGCFLPLCPTHLVPLIPPGLLSLTSEP